MASDVEGLFRTALEGSVGDFLQAFSELRKEKTDEDVQSLLRSVDDSGNTILHRAVLRRKHNIVKELLTKEWFPDDKRNRELRVNWLKSPNNSGNKPHKLTETSPLPSTKLQEMLLSVGRENTLGMVGGDGSINWNSLEAGWKEWLETIDDLDFSGPVLIECQRWLLSVKREESAPNDWKKDEIVSRIVRSAAASQKLESMCRGPPGGRGLLHEAVLENNTLLLKIILQTQFKDTDVLDNLLGVVDTDGNNLLHHALLAKKLGAIDVLLNSSPASKHPDKPDWNVRWMKQTNNDNKTPFHLAKELDDTTIKGKLLGAIGLTSTGTGLSAEEAAIKYEKWSALKTWSEIITGEDFSPLVYNMKNLLHHLASKWLSNDGSDSQCYLAQTVIRNVLDKLKKHGVGEDNLLYTFLNHKANGRLPIHDAARSGNDFLLAFLADENGASSQKSILNEKDDDENTVLHHAVEHRRASTLKVFLRQRWQKHQQQQQQEWDKMILNWFSAENKNKKTPLHLLLQAGGYGTKMLSEIKKYLLSYIHITFSKTEVLCHRLQCATALDDPLSTPPDPGLMRQRSITCEQLNGTRTALLGKLEQLLGSRIDDGRISKIQKGLLQIAKEAGKTCVNIPVFCDFVNKFHPHDTGDACGIITEHANDFLTDSSTTPREAEYYMRSLAKFLFVVAKCDLRGVDFQEVGLSLLPLTPPVTVEVALRLEYLSSILAFLRQDEYWNNLLHWRELQRRMKCAEIMQDAFPPSNEENKLVDKLAESVNELLLVQKKIYKVRLIVNKPDDGKSPMAVLMGPTGNPKMLQDMLELGIESEEKELGCKQRNILHTAADIPDFNILTKFRDYFLEMHKLETDTDAVNVDKYLRDVTSRLNKISQDNITTKYIKAVKGGTENIKRNMSDAAKSSDRDIPVEGSAQRLRDTLLHKDPKGETPLHIAARHDLVTHVKLLTALWKSVLGSESLDDLLNVRDGRGRVPFLSSAAGGAVESAIFLVRTEGTRHVYAQDNDGKNALTIAMENDHVVFVKMLLLQVEGEGKALYDYEARLSENRVTTNVHKENGMDVPDGGKRHQPSGCQFIDERYRNEIFNSVDSNFLSVVHHAVIDQKEEMLSVLLQSGARECLFKKDSDHERTPYLWAVRTGNINMVKKIVGALTKLGHVKSIATNCDKNDNTAGHIAAEFGYLRIIKYLQFKKINLHARNKAGKTPLGVAIEYGQQDVLEYLVKECQQREQDIDLSQSLIGATEKGHKHVVQYLLNLENPAVAGVGLIDGRPFNVLDIAINSRNTAMAAGILSSLRRNEVLNDICGRSTPFQKLLKYMPDVAETLLDQYITKDKEACNFLVDYSLLDEQNGSFVRADILIVELPGVLDEASKPRQIVVPVFRRDTGTELEERLQKEWDENKWDGSIAVKVQTGTVRTASTSKLRYQIEVKNKRVDVVKITVKVREGYHMRLANKCIGVQDDSNVAEIERSILRTWKDCSGLESFVAVFDKDGNRQLDKTMNSLRKGFQLLINGQKFYMDPRRHGCYQYLPNYSRCVTKKEVGMMSPIKRKMHHPLRLLFDNEGDQLIQHPVAVSCIKHHWDSNKIIYFTTTVIMLFYSMALAINISGQARHQNLSVCTSACGLASNASLYITMVLCLLVAIMGLIREALQIWEKRWSYVNADNVVDMISYIMTVIVVTPWTWQYKHLIGAFAVLITCLNTLFYMRALPVLGIFISMLRNILKTIVKYCPVLLALILIFAACFHIVMHKLPYLISAVTMYVMMTGELEYSDRYLPSEDGNSSSPSAPERYTGLSLLVVFITIMSIIVANLLIGLTVCDVTVLTKNARKHILIIKGRMILDGLFNNLSILFRHWYVSRKPEGKTDSILTIPMQPKDKDEHRFLHWCKATFTLEKRTLTKKSIAEECLKLLAKNSEEVTAREPESNPITERPGLGPSVQKGGTKTQFIHTITEARLGKLIEEKLKQQQQQQEQQQQEQQQQQSVQDVKATTLDTQMFAPHGGQLYREKKWRKLYQTDSLDSMFTLLYIEYKQNLDFPEYLRALEESPVANALKCGLALITGSIGSWTDARLVWMDQVHGTMDAETCSGTETETIFRDVKESELGRLTPDKVTPASKCSGCKTSPTHELGPAEVIESILKDRVENINAYRIDLLSILNDSSRKLKCNREVPRKGKKDQCTGTISYTFQVTDSPMLICVRIGGMKLRGKYRIKLRDFQRELLLLKSDKDNAKAKKERFARYELAMVTILSEQPRRYWSVIKVGDSWWRHDPKLLMQQESCRAKIIPHLEEMKEPEDERSYINYVVYRKDVSWTPDKG